MKLNDLIEISQYSYAYVFISLFLNLANFTFKTTQIVLFPACFTFTPKINRHGSTLNRNYVRYSKTQQ